MNGDLLRPDGFAIGLFAFGLVMLFLPLMEVPGIVAMLAALVYWLTMIIVNSSIADAPDAPLMAAMGRKRTQTPNVRNGWKLDIG